MSKVDLEIMTGFWRDLKEHAERGAVFLVSSDLDLNEVGEAIRDDNTKKVEGWLTSGGLSRPLEKQLESWNENLTIQFRFVILQPYVLIQLLGH